MNYQTEFLIVLKKNGASATIASKTGTVCPCFASRGQNAYSPDWHVNNPTAAACGGTGLISVTSTTINIKAFFFPVAVGMWGTQIPENIKTLIGEKVDADLVMYGTLNDTTDAVIDLNTYVEAQDLLTYDSVVYRIRNVYDLDITTGVGQVALLKRNV
jgi:hypothetical protein